MAATYGYRGLIFDATSNELITLLHADKKYMRIDTQAMKKLAQGMGQVQDLVAEQMAGMSPDQRAKLESLLPGLNIQGLVKKENTEAKIVKTGKTEKIHGNNCEVVEIIKDGNKLSEACLANIKDVGMSRQDFATVEAFFSQIEGVASRMPKANDNVLFSNLIFANELIPLRASDFNKDSRRDISFTYGAGRIDAQMFVIPDGFEQQNIAEGIHF